MKTICLKFPDKATAHSFLYGEQDEPLYPNIADNNRKGLPMQRIVTDESEYLTWPEDGSYCADIAGLDKVPGDLESYVITPNPAYRKHKFLGE